MEVTTTTLKEAAAMALDAPADVPALPEEADPDTDWPVARLTITEDDKVTATMYAPGLPPGQHDVWCVPVAAPVQPAPVALTDATVREMLQDTREVFDAEGPETPQIVRDVIEYVASLFAVYADKTRAGIPAPTTGEG